MRDDTKSYLYYGGGLLCAVASRFIYKKYCEYADYEKGVRDNDIDTPQSLISREKNNEELKDPGYEGKMVYVSGFALSETNYHSLTDSLSKIGSDHPS
jgi:hypothetical protein